MRAAPGKLWIRIDIDFEPRARARSREGVPMLKTAAGALSGMLVTFGPGCANTVAAHRPLSEENLASVHDSLVGRQARETLAGLPPARPLPAKHGAVAPPTEHWLGRGGGTQDWHRRTDAIPIGRLEEADNRLARDEVGSAPVESDEPYRSSRRSWRPECRFASPAALHNR